MPFSSCKKSMSLAAAISLASLTACSGGSSGGGGGGNVGPAGGNCGKDFTGNQSEIIITSFNAGTLKGRVEDGSSLKELTVAVRGVDSEVEANFELDAKSCKKSFTVMGLPTDLSPRMDDGKADYTIKSKNTKDQEGEQYYLASGSNITSVAAAQINDSAFADINAWAAEILTSLLRTDISGEPILSDQQDTVRQLVDILFSEILEVKVDDAEFTIVIDEVNFNDSDPDADIVAFDLKFDDSEQDNAFELDAAVSFPQSVNKEVVITTTIKIAAAGGKKGAITTEIKLDGSTDFELNDYLVNNQQDDDNDYVLRTALKDDAFSIASPDFIRGIEITELSDDQGDIFNVADAAQANNELSGFLDRISTEAEVLIENEINKLLVEGDGSLQDLLSFDVIAGSLSFALGDVPENSDSQDACKEGEVPCATITTSGEGKITNDGASGGLVGVAGSLEYDDQSSTNRLSLGSYFEPLDTPNLIQAGSLGRDSDVVIAFSEAVFNQVLLASYESGLIRNIELTLNVGKLAEEAGLGENSFVPFIDDVDDLSVKANVATLPYLNVLNDTDSYDARFILNGVDAEIIVVGSSLGDDAEPDIKIALSPVSSLNVGIDKESGLPTITDDEVKVNITNFEIVDPTLQSGENILGVNIREIIESSLAGPLSSFINDQIEQLLSRVKSTNYVPVNDGFPQAVRDSLPRTVSVVLDDVSTDDDGKFLLLKGGLEIAEDSGEGIDNAVSKIVICESQQAAITDASECKVEKSE